MHQWVITLCCFLIFVELLISYLILLSNFNSSCRLSLFSRHSGNLDREFLWNVCMVGWSKMQECLHIYNFVRKHLFSFQLMWLLVDSIFLLWTGWSRWLNDFSSYFCCKRSNVYLFHLFRLIVQKILQLTFIELAALLVSKIQGSRCCF